MPNFSGQAILYLQGGTPAARRDVEYFITVIPEIMHDVTDRGHLVRVAAKFEFRRTMQISRHYINVFLSVANRRFENAAKLLSHAFGVCVGRGHDRNLETNVLTDSAKSLDFASRK
ncbi:MAG: hypothetical protein ACOH2H_00115 [Cypionkella sp.]